MKSGAVALRRQRRGQRQWVRPGGVDFSTALTMPALLFVLALGIWPLADFLLGSLHSTSGYSIVHYRALLADDLFVRVAGRTVLLAMGVTAIAVVLGYPLAYVLMRTKGASKALLLALVALPYLTSVLVRVYAWAALLALDGPVNRLFVAMKLFDSPRLLGHSMEGTVIGMVHVLCPIAVLTMWSQFEKIDRTQQLVAASLGASKVSDFLTVFLPQSLPGIASAAALVYVLALGAYVIPAALGSTQGLLFAQLVVEQATQLLDWEMAGAMGLLMLTTAAIPIVVIRGATSYLAKRSRKQSLTFAQHLTARFVYPVLEWIPLSFIRATLIAVSLAVLVFLLAPELVVLVFAFGPEKQVVFPPPSFSLDGYRAVLSDPGWLEAGQRSVLYALFDATIALVLGTLAAYGFVRGSWKWARFGSAVLLAPLVLPEVIVAISFFIYATKMQLAGTATGIILGQAVGTIGLVVVILGAVLRGTDVSLEHAAQTCAASRLKAFRDVVLPLIAPAMAVGFIYGFLHAFDNLITPLFIAGTRATITVRMFLSMQEELTTAPAVIASILIFALVAALAGSLVLFAIGRRRAPWVFAHRAVAGQR